MPKKDAETVLNKSRREAADYRYALEEACIETITDQKAIITYANRRSPVHESSALKLKAARGQRSKGRKRLLNNNIC